MPPASSVLPTVLPTVLPAVLPADLVRMDRFEAAVDAVAHAYDFARHPYFVWLEGPRATRDAFLRSQLPFRFAVEAFSQALAAVLARTPSVEQRMALAENVAEEHGHFELQRTHKHTFAGFLRALGAADGDLAQPCPVVVTAFDRSLLDHCLVERHEVGAALLGIIEHLYTGISHAIAGAIVARGWVGASGQQHYILHEQLDVVHARDLFALARPGWDAPLLRAAVADGLALGAHHFWRLYADLAPGE
jgi:pyrroloquinoline-quinone synthase